MHKVIMFVLCFMLMSSTLFAEPCVSDTTRFEIGEPIQYVFSKIGNGKLISKTIFSNNDELSTYEFSMCDTTKVRQITFGNGEFLWDIEFTNGKALVYKLKHYIQPKSKENCCCD